MSSKSSLFFYYSILLLTDTSPTSQLQPLQRESHPSSLPLTPNVPLGWNPSHSYNTRFKKHHLANFSSVATSDFSPPLNPPSAYHSSYEHLSSFDFPLAFTAPINSDVLHYGALMTQIDPTLKPT
jgi:hypothetical protein